MDARSLARGSLGVAGLLGLAFVTATSAARADAPIEVVACTLTGAQAPPKGTAIFDAPVGGQTIATFTGAVASLKISELPVSPAAARAKVTTASGAAGLHITGYVQVDAITAYTTRDLPVVIGHVWLSSTQDVKITRASAAGMTVEHTIAGSQGQKVRAEAPCDALSLAPGAPTGLDLGDKARGYLMKTSSLALYDAPNGDAVFALQMLEGAGQLLWSTQAKGGFVLVHTRSDVTIEAWAKLSDLTALKKGEMLDQLAPTQRATGGATLAFDKPPRVGAAKKDVLLRAKRDESAKPIGVLDAGAEVYVLETVAGWTHVLPKDLAVMPPDGGGFWVPAADAP